MRQQLTCRATVRIVTIAQNFVQDNFRPGVIGLRDACFRQYDSTFAKAFDRVVVRFSRNYSIRQIEKCGPEFFVRDGEIFRLHRSFAARQGCFALRDGALTPLHFALGDSICSLCKA